MTDEETIEHFTEGDCWMLALELKKRYPHLTVCTLIDPYWADGINHSFSDPDEVDNEPSYDFMEWSHAVVKDPNTGIYYDVEGEHRPENGLSEWKKYCYTDIWEIADEDLEDYFSDAETLYWNHDMEHGVRLATVAMPTYAVVG